MLADPTVAPDIARGRPASRPRHAARSPTAHNWTTTVVGTTPDWLQVRARTVAAGPVLHRGRARRAQPGSRARVDDGAASCSASRDPVGQTVTIDGASRSPSSACSTPSGSTVGGDQDDQAIVPRDDLRHASSRRRAAPSVSTIYLRGDRPGHAVRRLPGGDQRAADHRTASPRADADFTHQQPGVARRDRDQHRRAPSPSCSAASRRSRCWSAASAS